MYAHQLSDLIQIRGKEYVDVKKVRDASLCATEQTGIEKEDVMISVTEHYIDKLNSVTRRALFDTFNDIKKEKPTLKNIVDTPFFVDSLVEKRLWKSSFAYSTDQYSSESGLSPEQILTSPFVFLSHATYNSKVIEPIFKSGKLDHVINTMDKKVARDVVQKSLTSEDAWKYGWGEIRARNEQFPGVYMVPHTYEDYQAHQRGAPFIFIVSIALMKKEGWHINKFDSWGSLTKFTWDYTSLPQYLIDEAPNTVTFGELVAHYPIPLDYVEAIICYSGELDIETELDGLTEKDYAIKMTKKYGYKHIPVYWGDEYEKLVPTKKIKFLYDEGSYSNNPPNFCYDNWGYFYYNNKADHLDKKDLRAMLLNCGYSVSKTNDMLKKPYEEVVHAIRQKWTESIVEKKYSPAVVHPPFLLNI